MTPTTASSTQPGDDSSTDPTAATVARLVERAADALAGLADERRDDGLLDELVDVVEELLPLLETVDPATVLDAVDVERLPTLVDPAGLLEALTTGDYRSAIAYEHLSDVVDAPRVVESTDVREGWRRSRDLGDEVADVTDALSGDDGDDAASEAERDDSSEAEATNDAAEHEAAVEVAASLSETDEGRQLVVQKTVSSAVAEVRSDILDARDRIAATVEDHEARTGRVDRPTSRNPSAFSTLPRSGPPAGTAAFSTVPMETRYSDAPNFERIYGRRFEREREE
ncbi:hypothetical protein ACFPYI_14380 [Halomarina salina]|uniref:Uncharacterized protein n=1 Tax=Halomarina salina TaxID=1872699 RepID=A0ABD5RQA1_9EURY|nr:hypothetical protein [Halomarina salina]